MARPQKLNEDQIAEARRRYCGGEPLSSLAAAFDVTKPTIAKFVSFHRKEIEETAKQIVDTEERLAALPLSGRLEAIELADELRAISRNLAGSARHSSFTSFRLSAIAGKQVEKINVDDPMESQEVLQCISALTKMSNDAANLPLALLNINKSNGKDKQADTEEFDGRVLVYLPENGR